MDTNLTSRNVPDVEDRREVERLALELAEVKGVLREMSDRVRRVERRVGAVLSPLSKPAQKHQLSREHRLRTPDETRRLIHRLTERAGASKQIEDDLRNLPVKGGLAEVARELGMTNTKLPPKDDLIRRLSTRLRQRAHVLKGIDKY